jgi:hypothetical protein
MVGVNELSLAIGSCHEDDLSPFLLTVYLLIFLRYSTAT